MTDKTAAGRRATSVRRTRPSRWVQAPKLGALALVSLVATGCGSSAAPSTSTASAKPAAASTASLAAKTTPSTPASSSPELIVCEEEPGSRVVELSALSGGAEGVSARSVASFSDVSEKTCALSPDLSKLAELSETSDSSKVAGYLPAGGGSFVNLSGHNSNSYSNTAVIDVGPLFSPTSGDLWWMAQEGSGFSLWSAPAAGGAPENHGAAQLGGNLVDFTPTGEPIAVSLARSPDGTLAAFTTKEVLHEEGIELTIGRASALTADCVHSNHGCGLAQVPFLEGAQSSVACQTFIGFVSNSAVVCQNNENGLQRFDRLDFRLAGRAVKVTDDTPLTPSTQMLIGGVVVSPDGKTLWYTASREASETQPSAETHLYIVPTEEPTSEPSPVSVTPEVSLATIIMAGWRWHGHFQSGA